MIVIAGEAKIHEAQRESAVAEAAAMAMASRAEPGCIDYRFSVDVDDPCVVRLFEVWENAEALDAHFATPHFAAFGAVVASAVSEEPSFTKYDVSSAGPLFG